MSDNRGVCCMAGVSKSSTMRTEFSGRSRDLTIFSGFYANGFVFVAEI